MKKITNAIIILGAAVAISACSSATDEQKAKLNAIIKKSQNDLGELETGENEKPPGTQTGVIRLSGGFVSEGELDSRIILQQDTREPETGNGFSIHEKLVVLESQAPKVLEQLEKMKDDGFYLNLGCDPEEISKHPELSGLDLKVAEIVDPNAALRFEAKLIFICGYHQWSARSIEISASLLILGKAQLALNVSGQSLVLQSEELILKEENQLVSQLPLGSEAQALSPSLSVSSLRLLGGGTLKLSALVPRPELTKN